MPQYPNVVKNFVVLNASGTVEIGLATITLPKVTFEKSEYTGAGVSGRMNLPIGGNVTDMSVTLDFHTTTADALSIFNGESAQIRCVSSLWSWDTSAGKSLEIPEEIYMTVCSAMYDPESESIPPRAGSSSRRRFSTWPCTTISKKMWEIDPFGDSCIINGVQLNAQTQINLRG